MNRVTRAPSVEFEGREAFIDYTYLVQPTIGETNLPDPFGEQVERTIMFRVRLEEKLNVVVHLMIRENPEVVPLLLEFLAQYLAEYTITEHQRKLLTYAHEEIRKMIT